MYEEIETRFQTNLDRATNLIDIYTRTRGEGGGRRSVKDTDVLRAGVVLLHASLEDVLRSLMRSRLPDATPETLNEAPLLGTAKGGRAEKFLLGSLVSHKGKTVNQVIKESVDDYYGQISFNDATEIVSKLRRAQIAYDDDGLDLLGQPDDMIKRRHNIVHQADKNPNTGQGEYHAQAINPDTLGCWIDNVKTFIHKVLEIARA